MSVVDCVQELVDKLNDSLGDASKHDKGNKAAGTRFRKTLQEVSNCCKELRKQIQEERKTRE